MVVGITATREGASPDQLEALRARLIECGATVLHHGDCVGGDSDAHDVALALGIRIVVHPPQNDKLRAYRGAIPRDIVLPAKPYLPRNRDIVNAAELLFVIPKELEEPAPARGQGTWSTVRYARATETPVEIIWRKEQS